MKNNIGILVCGHNEFDMPDCSVFLKYIAGKESGKNIAEKNPFYSELTGMYWLWKNIDSINSDFDYIGLNHYRRYFDFDKKNYLPIIYKDEKYISNYFFDFARLDKILNNYDCVVAKKNYFPYSIEIQFCKNHNSEDYRKLKECVKKYTPEYFESFVNVMENNNSFFPFNMFIMKKELFNEYCEWIFNLFSKLEDELNIENYSTYQKRIYGFFSERLLNVFIYYKKLKLKELPVVQFSNDFFNLSFLRYSFDKIRNRLGYFISSYHRKN